MKWADVRILCGTDILVERRYDIEAGVPKMQATLDVMYAASLRPNQQLTMTFTDPDTGRELLAPIIATPPRQG
jgi:hypothetical protein